MLFFPFFCQPHLFVLLRPSISAGREESVNRGFFSKQEEYLVAVRFKIRPCVGS
jgi:hypothetical protein